MQTLEERAETLAALARDDRSRGRMRNAVGLEERVRETPVHVDGLRETLGSLAL